MCDVCVGKGEIVGRVLACLADTSPGLAIDYDQYVLDLPQGEGSRFRATVDLPPGVMMVVAEQMTKAGFEVKLTVSPRLVGYGVEVDLEDIPRPQLLAAMLEARNSSLRA